MSNDSVVQSSREYAAKVVKSLVWHKLQAQEAKDEGNAKWQKIYQDRVLEVRANLRNELDFITEFSSIRDATVSRSTIKQFGNLGELIREKLQKAGTD